MTLCLGKVIAAPDAAHAAPIGGGSHRPTSVWGHVVPRVLVDAAARAEALLNAAQAQASAHLLAAEQQAAAFRTEIERVARAEARSELAAAELRLHALEARADERTLDRTVELARLLAERLLGRSLALEASAVVDLAQQALAEVRGARSVTLSAHPRDLPALEVALANGGLERVARVVGDPQLSPGSFVFQSELGRLEADLGTQLDRLTERLRGALRGR